MPEENQIIMELGDKMIVLSLQPFDEAIDVEDLVRIDYYNILGEILTFPAAFNRIANLKAEADYIVKRAKMNSDITRARLYKKYRAGNGEGKKPSIVEIEALCDGDQEYIDAQEFQFTKEKEAQYLDNFYWSAQQKASLLQRLSDKIQPDDMAKDLVEGSINNVNIKFGKKMIR